MKQLVRLALARAIALAERMRTTAFLTAILLSSTPAIAQTQAPTPAASNEVVVVGRGKDEPSLEQQIQDVVRGFTPGSPTSPLARFDREQLCPHVVGLDARFNGLIASRMRRIAAAAKIALARGDCRRANVLVIFTDNKANMVTVLRRRYPALFRDEHNYPIRVAEEEGPALAWHVRGLVTRDGTPIVPGSAARTSGMASRLTELARPIFVLAVVIVEREGIDGLTATQIADYAAMRAFSDATPARARAVGIDTILTSLDTSMGGETPLTLTTWDMSYLQGLYAAPVNATLARQRGAIGTVMKRELARGENPAEEHGNNRGPAAASARPSGS